MIDKKKKRPIRRPSEVKRPKRTEERPLILISNDDGIGAAGIKALKRSIKRLGDVYVVAPDRERSAASHSLTLHRPLRVDEVAPGEFAVDGTPTDCIIIAVNRLLPRMPDLIVSGINNGGNLGEDISYSGTVSAAVEGTLLGIPSIAVSLVGRADFDFGQAAAFTIKVAREVLKRGLPVNTLLNVNVPRTRFVRSAKDGSLKARPLKKPLITTQGKRVYGGDVIIEKLDPRGRKYYWIGGDMLHWDGDDNCDFAAIADDRISITPVQLDMTCYREISELEKWKF
ncbi:5'-nucleotidase SurE [hydrothermal vent metagenome]|uniref:5'-nucleotidase n=1 Tax=hydrothermal vent metagenome TaxID=652676 RepID=A0A3B0VBM1_9ZZZZ